MDGGSREAVSSSGQLEDWAAGVAEDLRDDPEEDNNDEPKTGPADRAKGSPRQRNSSQQSSAAVKRSKQQDRESSPEDEDGAKDEPRPKLPRPDKKETCPRCNSLDTKFCYYNNYNIKQPRFYCKTCQRYWTAGGTLRNIAPGSGRRKSKSKTAGRESRNSPLLPDHLTAAAAAAQTGVFSLPVNAAAAYGSLNPALLAAADPAGILSNGTAATTAYTHPQLLGGHNGLASLKLAGVSQLHGQWAGGGGLPSELNGSSALREQLQAQLTAGASVSAGIGPHSIGSLDARVLLSGQASHHHDDLPAVPPTSGQVQPQHQGQSQQGNAGHPSSPSASPPPQQQQQVSSPHQPNSQLSQQPSPPQVQNGSVSEDPDTDGIEVCVPGRRIRRKAEPDALNGSIGIGLGSSGLGVLGALGASSLQSAQLASLNLPPSMASLAAVMGPGGGGASLGSGLHPLLCATESAAGGLLDGAHGSLSRQQLHLALQQHQVAQQESFQHLNGLLPHNAVTAAALHAQHPLLQGLGHQGVISGGAVSSTAAAVAALDPLQRSALLQQAAGLGGVGCWLSGGNSMSNMLPSAAMAAAALESLQAQTLGVSGAPSLLQAAGQSSTSPAEWISLAAAAAAAGPKGQGLAGSAHQSAAAAIAAAHAANLGMAANPINGAAQILQAQAAAGGGCGSGAAGWGNSSAFAAVPAGAPSWSLWSSYSNPASSNYAGYALQAAAAAYSNGR